MKRRKHRYDRRGAAIVEMALVVPIFFTVVLGVIEFGRAMMVSQLVTNAARTGVRSSIVGGSSNTEVEKVVKSFCQTAMDIDPGDVSVTTTVTAGAGNTDPGNEVANAQSGDLCAVTVSVPFDKVSYVTGKFLSGRSLVATCAMQYEGD